MTLSSKSRAIANLAQTFALLRSARVAMWYAGATVSTAHQWIWSTTTVWLVRDLAGSASDQAIAAALSVAPVFLAGPLGGVLADTLSARRLLIISQALNLAVVAGLFVLAETDGITRHLVFAAVFVSGTIRWFGSPAQRVIEIGVVGEHRIAAARTLSSLGGNIAYVAGLVGSGVIIEALGAGRCLAVTAGCTAVCLVIAAVTSKRSGPTPGGANLSWRYAVGDATARFREALRHVKGEPGLWVPLGTGGLVMCLGGNVTLVLQLMARDVWPGTGGGGTTFALLSAAVGVGGLVGAFLTGFASTQPTIRALPIALAAAAAGTAELAVSWAPSVIVAMLFLFGMGVSNSVFWWAITTAIQQQAAPALRGRTMALYEVVTSGLPAVGAVVVAGLAGAHGPRAALGFEATGRYVAAAFAIAAFAVTRRRASRCLTHTHPQKEFAG